ncbi:MAG TPA: hypothetical protein VGL56_08625 [Fimbriimonadaceae bacterium]|jgi:ribosomal protein L11 methylase PrmA
MAPTRLPSSFRDPSGFIFERDGVLLRQVNQSYAGDFELFESSGLSDALVRAKLLVPYQQAGLDKALSKEAISVLQPEKIEFISYPYEWCFSQLKDAALLTLRIQMVALDHGMCLKDASAYNVQFWRGKPVFIDTLSFEKYEEGKPWIAYKQFCQHFLAPLALMSFTDVRLSSLLRTFIDGIPLDLASRLLPKKTRFQLGLMLHIHGHAKAQAGKSDGKAPAGGMTKTAMKGIISNLESTVSKLTYEAKDTEWADYYSQTNYSQGARTEKEKLVAQYLGLITPSPKTAWDLGANTGEFSRIASEAGISTIAWDIDPAAVEKGYQMVKSAGISNLLPLLEDFSNPSPSLGWANQERQSLEERGRVDAVMALALIHHLAIGNNVPLADVATFFVSLAKWAIVEFVPKEDSQTQKLLHARKDVFTDYSEEGFETAFGRWYQIVKKDKIEGSHRTLYLLKERGQ